ncbi:MAG: ABC transporter substrate-binding protein [Proteobacteria bacterium]|nr:ABC transporter substrate-binding protein [Pseudomonadota bacterium]MBI3499804.1 ABC transporter substrate-binding protein [Pseudomonadota bacterium]
MKSRLQTTRRTLLQGAAALGAGVAFLPRGLRAQASGPIRIAGLVPLTGGGGAFGPNMSLSQKTVVDEVNAAGGLLGRKVELITEDDQTNPEAGVRAARKLIDVDKVSAIMSVWASAVGTAVLPLCWENKVMMLAISAADTIAELPHQGYFVRTQPHTALQGEQFAKFAIDTGTKHLYVMMPQTPFTETVIKGITQICQSKNIKVTSMIYDAKKTSLRSEVDEMMRTTPDTLMIGGYQPDDIVLAKDVFRANYKGRVVGFAYGMTPQFVEGAGAEVTEGMYTIEPIPAAGSTAYGRLQKLLKKDALDTYTCQGYDHANLALLAIAQAKEASGTAIRDNIRKIGDPAGVKVDNAVDGIKLLAEGKKINYEGASGPCKFTDIGNIREVVFRLNQIKAGKILPA